MNAEVAPRRAAAQPPALHALQQRFVQHMLGAADASALLAGSAERRALGLGIYANAYRRRLVEALADAYAKTCAWLGEEGFDRVALHHIERNPPRTRNLRWYGADFAEHLPAELPQRAALAELARLEWTLRGAFDGADSVVLDSACLATVAPGDWETLRWLPVPTAQMLAFDFDTVAVWQALDVGQVPPPFEAPTQPLHWLVWRKELQPHFRSLGPAEATLLRLMLEGCGFAEACMRAQGEFDTLDAEQIGSHLRQWLDDGVIAARDSIAQQRR